jgi:hypothetical protein
VRSLPVLALAASLVLSAAAQTNPPPDLLQNALSLSVEDELASREYVLTQESIEREIGSDGKVVSVKRKTFDIIPLGGEPYRRLIREDGSPLSEQDARREQEKFENTARERARESAEQRGEQLRKYEEKLQARREMFDELPKALTYRVVGEDVIDGHAVWVIEAEPRPGYEPRSLRTRFLTKMRGRVYIAKQQQRMIKVEMVTTGPVSFGWFLAKMAPGTRIVLEQMQLPEGIFVMKRFQINYDVKVALLKQIRGETEHRMWDYRRDPISARR